MIKMLYPDHIEFFSMTDDRNWMAYTRLPLSVILNVAHLKDWPNEIFIGLKDINKFLKILDLSGHKQSFELIEADGLHILHNSSCFNEFPTIYRNFPKSNLRSIFNASNYIVKTIFDSAYYKPCQKFLKTFSDEKILLEIDNKHVSFKNDSVASPDLLLDSDSTVYFKKHVQQEQRLTFQPWQFRLIENDSYEVYCTEHSLIFRSINSPTFYKINSIGDSHEL